MRRHVWSLLHLRPGGFPWLTVAGKRLTGWIIIDIDATIITSASKKAGAAVTFKKTFGFHPLAAWCANTTGSLAMLLRPGNAGANTVADHLAVLTEAIAQIPGSSAAKILVRVDGAGATHGLLEYLEALNTTRRTVRYTVGWKITDDDEKAIARLTEAAWETSVHQDGSLQEGYFVAELTGVNTHEGWPEGMRLIVRRVRPTRRHLKKLTAFETRTGWRYCITATNIGRMWGIAVSGHAQFLDVLHRAHAGVEDRVHQQSDGPGQLALRLLGGQPRLDARREHRRRSRRMAAAAGPARDRRPGRRRAGHHALPPLSPARTPRRPRPPPPAADRADLTLGRSVHHLLAAAHRPPRRHLMTGRQPRRRPGRSRTSTFREPWTPAQPQRYAKAPHAIARNKRGEPVARSGNQSR